jgi:carbonic anhydrase
VVYLGVAFSVVFVQEWLEWQVARYCLRSLRQIMKKVAISPDGALNRLKEGNQNFLQDKQSTPKAMGSERRMEIARSQSPFAVLVSCSDSRVPLKLLFGCGLGELFIIRNAGNTVDTVALGSIEYAVYALGVSLIVVQGHDDAAQ